MTRYAIGIAHGSPVSLDYYDKAPFKFNGTIEQVHVEYVTGKEERAVEAPQLAATARG
jgi:hypothetical protein